MNRFEAIKNKIAEMTAREMADRFCDSFDALYRIEQLEAAPAPAPAQEGLPKGWIKLTYADGSAAFVNTSKLTSFGKSDSYPQMTEVCCGRDANLVKESTEEIMHRIREALV